ncbi:hypothetical protein M407DRAFT_216545 [Tulasnella calospora MUT 4182]|uniref:Armadillo repeat-containing protein 8 n=1 Tax=Tulasnella calospora MUT 4182 TaxID=1051891 RepID=A0A0C3QIS8_9AGAM|nr:hypothetical protein M407DRAFT_216545 [Tulasnella calospora MUT 4182]
MAALAPSILMEDVVTSNYPADSTADEVSFEIGLDRSIRPDGQLSPEVIHEVNSPDAQTQLQSVTKIGRLLRSPKRSPYVAVQAVIRSGLIPILINMLSSPNTALGSEASRTVLNMTLGTSQQTSAIIFHGVIPKLIAASYSDIEEIKLNSLRALGNIAADSEESRDAFLDREAFWPALDILADPEDHSAKVVNTAAWVMETCTTPGTSESYNDTPTFGETIPVLCSFIRPKGKPKLLAIAVKVLRRLCITKMAADMIFDSEAVPRLVQFCTSKNDCLREEALLLLSRFAVGSEVKIQAILDNDILQALQTCINDHASSRWAAGFAASSIATGTTPQAKVFAQSSVLSLLTGMISNLGKETRTMYAAVTTLHNLANHGKTHHEILSSLAEADCIEVCCTTLRSTHPRTIEKSVQIIEYLIDTPWSRRENMIKRLEDSDGVRCLREVWLGDEEWIPTARATAHKLLRAYFPEFSKPRRV